VELVAVARAADCSSLLHLIHHQIQELQLYHQNQSKITKNEGFLNLIINWEMDLEVAPISGCAAKASSQPLTSTYASNKGKEIERQDILILK